MNPVDMQICATEIKSRVETVANAVQRLGLAYIEEITLPFTDVKVEKGYLECAVRDLVAAWTAGDEEARIRVTWNYESKDSEGRPRAVFHIFVRLKDGTYQPVRSPMDRKPDYVNHPPHYNSHPSGVEAIDIGEHLSFNLGNALKYVWRAKHKGREEEDLEKAIWYLEREARYTKISGDLFELSYSARFNIQKVLDKEHKESVLTKFLLAVLTGQLTQAADRYGKMMEPVRSELKTIRKGNS